MSESLVYARLQGSPDFKGPGDIKSPGTTRGGGGPRTLILDLDETLVHSWEDPDFLEMLGIYVDVETYRKFHPTGSQQICYSFEIDFSDSEKRFWGLHRPHLHEFLCFARQYFDNIIVWSAGIQPYVQEITRQVFLDTGLPPPKLIWSRTNCSLYQKTYHKPIHELTVDLSNRYYGSLKINPESTLILDDKIYTFMENPQNGVLIPPYCPGKDRESGNPEMEDLLDRSDDALLKFMAWLELPEVRNCTDVRKLNKQHIFD